MRSAGEGLILDRATILKLLSASLWALLASAMLVESDVYRYVTLILAAFVVIGHRQELKLISHDWLATLCYGWAMYATTRFTVELVLYGERGASEWLYIFPVFFPVIGAALYLTRNHIYLACLLLLTAGLIGLLMTVDVTQTLAGVRNPPLFHKNPIHAGVGSGMLFLSAIFLLSYAIETGRLRNQWKWPTLALCGATAILCLLAMLGAQSKGVWLALACTIGFSGLLCLAFIPRKWRILALSGLTVAAIIAASSSSSVVTRVAGSTIAAAEQLTSTVLSTDLSDAMQQSIEDAETPGAMRERLMIWSNALEIFHTAPLFGRGNLWLQDWYKTTYADVGYTLLHNGFLEIVVRHGLFGLAFLGIFMVAALQRLLTARRQGLIATSTLAYLLTITVFFLCTITTNSNNRLAIGESFFILAGGAVFAVTLMLRQSAASQLREIE
jgi:O-antigen ligase